MPYCPECRTEYREGTERCADCGAELVDVLPEEPQPEWDTADWVTLVELGDETEARIIEGFLREQGVQVRLLSRHDRELATTLGELSAIELQVIQRDLRRAEELLEAREGESGASVQTPERE